MHSATKITAAVALLAVVATADMRGRHHHHHNHNHAQAKFEHRLAASGAAVDRLNSHTEAEENAATHRLQALLEKTRANTEHNIAVDAARYKALDAKLHANIGHLDREITEHDGQLALTKKQELIATNHIHELSARLARLAKHHVKLVRAKGVVAAERSAVTHEHNVEIEHLTKELNNVLATKAKLEKMEKYLQDPGTKVTFAELEEVMTAHSNGQAERYHVHKAEHFENEVKQVTDAQRAKNDEIYRVLQEFVGMLDKEIAQVQGAIKRSNDHFTTAIKVLDLKDSHLNNEIRDVELDQKTSSEHLSAEKVRLLDLKHKQALLERELVDEHKQHADLEHERQQEAVAEDRKQHNFSHEHDVENTLINMLGGSDAAPVNTEFNGLAAKSAAEKAHALEAKHQQVIAAQNARFAAAETLRLAKEHAKHEAQVARARAAAHARAEAAAKRRAAEKAREEAHRIAEAKHRAEVEAQRAAIKLAHEQAEAAAHAKAVADHNAAVAAKKARREHRMEMQAREREHEAQARADAKAAAVAAHQAAEAKVAKEEARRLKHVAKVAAKKHAADEARQAAILKAHTEAMDKAKAALEASAAKVAAAQAAAFQAKQKEIADHARAQQVALQEKVAAAEANAKAAAEAARAHAAQVAQAKAEARAAAKSARHQQRLAAKAARQAEEAKRHEEAQAFHNNVKAVFHH